MNKTAFVVGLMLLFPLFALAVQINSPQSDYIKLVQPAMILEVIWLALVYFAWLATRWQRGHWDANALSGSSNRRWFLIAGMLIGALFSVWGGYLGILDRVIW